MKIQVTILTFAFLCFSTFIALGQYTRNDFIITTKGLSEEYAARFKDSTNKDVLVKIFNQLNIIHDIAPINVIVTYENSQGNVIAEIKYDHDKIFSGNNDYSRHNLSSSRYGKCISVYLQNLIFAAIGQYKKSVATSGFLMDKDLLKFESTIKLKKANGDWINFYSFNYLNSEGFYPFTFYKNVHMSIGGKKYETETSNPKMLKEMDYFIVGKTIDLDGSITGSYYFCKFFNIETE